MKRPVDLSTWCIVLTALGMIILLLALYWAESSIAIVIVGIAIAGLCVAALLYMPLSVAVDDESLNLRLPLRSKKIPLQEIASVKLFPPTMAERRLCGSGGWFGYWGWFKEPGVGRYFAYYGKASDCFLLTLTDGKKYMLSCRNPNEMVELLTSKVGSRHDA